MTKPQLTVASCVADRDIFDTCLLSSIPSLHPHLAINILPIYNPNNVYSATIAANVAMEVNSTRFMLYVHQDVRLLPGAAEIIAKIIKNWPPGVAVIGAAGIKKEVNSTIAGPWGFGLKQDNLAGNVYDGQTHIWVGDTGIHKTQTVDEVFMLIDTECKIKFDSSLPGYHLYGLDYCLRARATFHGVMTADIPIEHVGKYSSSLYRDHSFLQRLVIMHAKWRSRFPSVFAPYCHWSDNRIASYIPFAIQNDNGERIDVPRIAVTISPAFNTIT